MTSNAQAQQRAAVESLLDRIAGDADFRRQLLENSEAAMEAAGLGAAGELEDAEVEGYKKCSYTCGSVSCSVTCPITVTG